MPSPAPQDPTSLQLDRRVHGPAVIVTAAGEVDMTTAALLSRELDLALDQLTPPGPLVADLQEIQFFGSSGIAALLEARDRCEHQRSDLLLVANTVVIQPMKITGVDTMFTLCPSLAEALARPAPR